MDRFNFDVIDSTNDKAKELLLARNNEQEVQKDFLVVANKQTKGRGRFGRKWYSDQGGAWFSIVKRNIINKPQLLSFCASLAVVKTLRELSYDEINFYLKWPNDVYFDKKKICGILLESIFEGKFDVIIGIGINIRNKNPQELAENTISLEEILKKLKTAKRDIDNIDICNVIDLVVKKFNVYFEKYLNSPVEIIEEWKKSCPYLGNEIIISTIKEKLTGIFMNIDENGRLILKTLTGEEIINEGDIRYTNSKDS